MEKEFVPYEIALVLKELGFDDECLMYWNDYGKQAVSRFQLLNRIDSWCINYIEAPLFSQAFRFFREKYNLIPNIHSIYSDETHTEIKFWFWFGNYEDDSDDEVFYGTYEEAELECLRKLIEIVKKI